MFWYLLKKKPHKMAILCISNANLVPELQFLLAPPLLVGCGPPLPCCGVLPHVLEDPTSWWVPTATPVPPSVSPASRGRRRGRGGRRNGRGASQPWAPPPGFSSLFFHWIFNSFFTQHSCEVILTVSTTEMQCSPFLERKRQKCYSVMPMIISYWNNGWLQCAKHSCAMCGWNT